MFLVMRVLKLLIVGWLVVCHSSASAQEEVSDASLPLTLVSELRGARDAGASWLVSRREQDGSFRVENGQSGQLLASATALWALCESRPDTFQYQDALVSAAWLLRHGKPDGGVYSGPGARSTYEATAVRRALGAVQAWQPSVQVERVIGELDAFLHEHWAAMEGVDPVARRLSQLDSREAELTDGQRRAMRFLNDLHKGKRQEESWLSETTRSTLEGDRVKRAPLYIYAAGEVRDHRFECVVEMLLAGDTSFSRNFADAPPVGRVDSCFVLLAASLVNQRIPQAQSPALLRELASTVVDVQQANGRWALAAGEGWAPDSVLTTGWVVTALSILLRE